MEDGYFFLHYLGVLLYVSCVLGLHPFALFNIHYIIKKIYIYIWKMVPSCLMGCI
jgi:hypothetical protein